MSSPAHEPTSTPAMADAPLRPRQRWLGRVLALLFVLGLADQFMDLRTVILHHQEED